MEGTGLKYPGAIRVIAAASIAALFIVFATTLSSRTKPPTVSGQSPVQLLSARQYIQETDTDDDGLPDWKEMVLGTNPNNADSDGDGVPDAEEALVPKIYSDSAVLALSSSTDTSLADVVGDRLMSEYATLKEKDLYTPLQASRLGESIAREISPGVSFTPYTIDELELVNDNSSTTLKMHREKMQRTLSPFTEEQEPEFALYARFIETGDTTALLELSRRARVYREVSDAVRAIPTPQDIAHAHLEVVNTLAFFASVLETMSTHTADPFELLAILGAYNQSEEYVKGAFVVLAYEYYSRLVEPNTL